MVRILNYFTCAIIAGFSLIVAGCQNAETSPEASPTTSTAADQRSTIPQLEELPRLPTARMQMMVDSIDHIDYLFYNLDFSMSLDEDKGIKYALAQIGEQPAIRTADCSAIGRLFYLVGGREVTQANLYFSPGCTYLEFVDLKGSATHANAMSDVGIDFLNNQFSQLIPDFEPIH